MSSPKERKVLQFARNKVAGRPVPISLKFSNGPLEGVEVGFTFRVQLSKEALARREKWLASTQAERQANLEEQILDEVCDLMIDEPTGFEDWPEKKEGDGPGNVGVRMRAYYNETTDEDALFFLKGILEAANNAYWASITPREFRPQV